MLKSNGTINLTIENKIRISFIFLLLFSFATIYLKIKVYPCIIFPHFANKHFGGNTVILKPTVYSFNSGAEIDMVNLIKPYDKRFILFTKNYLTNIYLAPQILRKLEQLNFEKTHVRDSFYLVLTNDTITNLK